MTGSLTNSRLRYLGILVNTNFKTTINLSIKNLENSKSGLILTKYQTELNQIKMNWIPNRTDELNRTGFKLTFNECNILTI